MGGCNSTCSPERCKSVERVRLYMAANGVADNLEKCRACRWLSAYKRWFDHETVKSYKEVE